MSKLSSRGAVTFARSGLLKLAILGCNALQVFAIARLLNAQSYALYASTYTNAILAIGLARTPIEMLFQRGAEVTPMGLRTEYAGQDMKWLATGSLISGTIIFAAICMTQRLQVSAAEYGLACLAVLIGITSACRRGQLIVEHKTDRVDFADFLIRPLIFVGLLAAASLAGAANRLMLVLFSASFIAVLLWPNAIALRNLAKRMKFGTRPPLRDWAKYFGTTALSAITKNIDVVLLTYIIGGQAVGSYYLLARMADLLAFGNNYANLRYTHVFAAAHRAKLQHKVHAVIRRAALVSGGVAVVGGSFAIAASPWLLPLVKAGLGRWQAVFIIVVAGQIVNGICGPNGSFLSILRPQMVIFIKATVSVLAFALFPAAIHSFGLVGAAAVTCFNMSLFNIICFVQLRRVVAAAYLKSDPCTAAKGQA